MRQPVVNIRCRSCQRVLKTITTMPATDVEYRRCEKHDMPDPRRIVDYLIRHNLDAMPLTRTMPLDEIRPRLERAFSTGRPVDLLT